MLNSDTYMLCIFEKEYLGPYGPRYQKGILQHELQQSPPQLYVLPIQEKI